METVVSASNYLLKTTLDTTLLTLKPVVKPLLQTLQSSSSSETSKASAIVDSVNVFNPMMSRWVAVAGLMGASAVALGAYGAHVVYPKDITDSRKAQFETANKYHFLNSLALLAVPHLRRPHVSGSLFVVGTVLFSGGCYYAAINDDQRVVKFVPVGGWALIAAWLSMAIFG